MYYIIYLFRIERHFDLIDKNDDKYVTLHELRDFQVAVYKKARMTPAEFRDQEWMLRNLYPRDLLGSDDKLDIEEYKAMKAGTSTPAPFATSLKPDMFSNSSPEKHYFSRVYDHQATTIYNGWLKLILFQQQFEVADST